MSTLPPVAFDDSSFKNHRPFDRPKPHGPAPQVLNMPLHLSETEAQRLAAFVAERIELTAHPSMR